MPLQSQDRGVSRSVFPRTRRTLNTTPASSRQVKPTRAKIHDNVRCHSGSGLGGPQLNHEWNAARLNEQSPPSTSDKVEIQRATRRATTNLFDPNLR